MLGRIFADGWGFRFVSIQREDLLVFFFPPSLRRQIILSLIQNQFYSIVFNYTSEISGGHRDGEGQGVVSNFGVLL